MPLSFERPVESGSVVQSDSTGGTQAAGLVSLSTSAPLIVSARQMRLSRMRSGVLTSARLLTEGLQQGGFRFRVAMITLTYAEANTWGPRHVSRMLEAVAKYLARLGHRLRCVWVSELTKAGRVHYHVALWLPRGVSLPKPDKRGWWPHGLTRIEWVRKGIAYLAKYVSKGEEIGTFPKGLRLHGVRGLDVLQRREKAWWRSPAWLREQWGIEHGPRRVARVGWVSQLTGEIVRSPWVIIERGPRWSWVKLARVGGNAALVTS